MAEDKKEKAAAPKKAEKAETAPVEKFVPNFKRKYLEEVAPALFKEHGYTSVMQVPRLEKIVVSIGCGDAVENKKLLETAVKELETITGKTCHAVNIIGGGCQDTYLDEMTARRTGLTVYAGPVEGTAIGNLAVQMISAGLFKDLKEARSCIAKSFEVKKFLPQTADGDSDN